MGRDGVLEVRADHGVWAAGWRLAVLGVVRTATRGRRRVVMFVSLGVIAAGLLVSLGTGIARGLDAPVVTVLVLVGTFALLAYLVIGVELVLWAMTDRRGIAAVEVDPQRLAHVRSEIAAGRATMVDPVDRRSLSRFGRVQQLALPATVLVHVIGVSVGLVLAGLEALAGSAGLVVVALAVIIVAVNAWSLYGTLRSLGTTAELVALDDVA